MAEQKHGSLQNMMLGGNVVGAPVPEVGMGVTFISWTDRNPGTIVKVDPKGNRFWTTDDDYKRIDSNGFSEVQKYEYTTRTDVPEEHWTEVVFKKTRKSKSNPAAPGSGKWQTTSGISVWIGRRQKYHDFSF